MSDPFTTYLFEAEPRWHPLSGLAIAADPDFAMAVGTHLPIIGVRGRYHHVFLAAERADSLHEVPILRLAYTSGVGCCQAQQAEQGYQCGEEEFHDGSRAGRLPST